VVYDALLYMMTHYCLIVGKMYMVNDSLLSYHD
jgi:hypothetical protein